MTVQRWRDGRVVDVWLFTEYTTVDVPGRPGQGVVVGVPGQEIDLDEAARYGLVERPKATARRRG